MNETALFKVVDRGDHRVYTDSRIFRAGDYKDKNFRLTPEELKRVAETFTAPVEVNLEHAPAMLKGKLGQVRSVWVDPNDPESLRGEVVIPKWLDDQLTDEERRVSAEFDRGEGKALVGLALTPTPRVKDAALMAAFTAAHPKSGDDPASPPAAKKSGERKHPMSLKEKLAGAITAFFSAEGIEIPDETTTTKPVPTATDAKVDALAAKVDALIASQTTKTEQKADFSEGDAKRAAATFATGLITDRKILPAERGSVEAAYLAASRADAVKFSDAGEATGEHPTLDAIVASFNARTPHNLTGELLRDIDKDDPALFALGPDYKKKLDEINKPINVSEVYATFNAQQTGNPALNGKGA